MDQTTLNFIAGGIMGCLGWFARTLWDRLREQEKRTNALEVMIARDYVSSKELKDALMDIKQAVTEVATEFRNDITYIRSRVDGLPQRRGSDPS